VSPAARGLVTLLGLLAFICMQVGLWADPSASVSDKCSITGAILAVIALGAWWLAPKEKR
jgi:hypothetical protein